MVANALQTEDLRIWVATAGGPLLVVDGLDLVVRAGTVHGIAGESGSGKSLSAQAMIGLLPDDMIREGRIELDGEDVSAISKARQREIRGSKIGMVFQDPMTSLHPMLSIERQLTEHMRHNLGIDREEARERAIGLLEEVRIPDPKSALASYPHQFSGGMRQRIAIAMALACEPKVLIADEPTTALDVTVQAGILRLCRRLCEERQLAVILITHDLGVMSAVADDLTIMYAGRVVESGDTQQVLTATRHPYADQLIKALPKPDEAAGEPLLAIAGDPATPKTRPSGCAFHPRCSHTVANCSKEIPPLVKVGEGHVVACPVDPLARKGDVA